MANKINKSLSVSLSMALKCSCIDTIKTQLFQLLTASWDVWLWEIKGIKTQNLWLQKHRFFFPGFTEGECICGKLLSHLIRAHRYVHDFLSEQRSEMLLAFNTASEAGGGGDLIDHKPLARPWESHQDPYPQRNLGTSGQFFSFQNQCLRLAN